MQGPSWIALFERIPVKLHDSVALTLVTGAEILMQSLLRLEDDFAILRGRVSGCTDAPRVLLLPFDQIVNVGFTKRMLDTEVETIFGKIRDTPSTGETPAAEEAGAALEPGKEAAQAPDAPNQGAAVPMRTELNKPSPPAPSAAPGKNQPPPPSKSLLLARLRARLAEKTK